MDEKKNIRGFVLIHGGGLESWVWDQVIPFLHYPAIAAHRIPDRTHWKSLTIADCAAYVATQMEQAGFTEAIIVAHSIGGVIAPEVAASVPHHVSHLVFVAANIPDEGHNAVSAFSFAERLQLRIGQTLAEWGITPKKAMQQWIMNTLCNDLDEDTTRLMIQNAMNPEPSSLLFDPVSREAMPSIPCTYIKLLNDLALKPDVQEMMAARVRATVRTITSGHTVMLSNPREFAAVLNDVAKETPMELNKPSG